MSSDKARGRADAAAGRYAPPQHGFFDTGAFDSKKEIERTNQRKQEYREGYHDKKREIGRSKNR